MVGWFTLWGTVTAAPLKGMSVSLRGSFLDSEGEELLSMLRGSHDGTVVGSHHPYHLHSIAGRVT